MPYIIDFNSAEIPELGLYNKNSRKYNQNLRFDDVFLFLHSIYLASSNIGIGGNEIRTLLSKIDTTQSYIHLDMSFTLEKYGENPH